VSISSDFLDLLLSFLRAFLVGVLLSSAGDVTLTSSSFAPADDGGSGDDVTGL